MKKNHKHSYEDLLELGEFYIISQKYNEAIKIFRKAEIVHNLDPKLYYDLGVAYEALNERDKAITSFRQALSLDAKYTAAQEHLAKLVGQ
jgi:protein O-GlcNAc transferase